MLVGMLGYEFKTSYVSFLTLCLSYDSLLFIV